jgi:hypothetical protein
MKTFIQFAEDLFSVHPDIRADLGQDRHFSPELFRSAIDRLLVGFPPGAVTIKTAGESYEKRPIRLITVGSGVTHVLLWSQMHGDESTATAAIADLLNYLRKEQASPEIAAILGSLTLHFLPMLNPDGAARRRRRTAQEIDMNRDAGALRTPEANLLKNLQQELKPQFGFNLHDQELSTTGTTNKVTAIALLAPAFDAAKSDNEVRRKAKLLCSAFARSMNCFAEGAVARYDDAFEPRAFGDNMQKWGTSTMLVESGHAPGDPNKESIRRLNFAGILSSLYAIGTGEFLRESAAPYEDLPLNSKKAYDLIVRSVTIEDDGRSFGADLGLSAQVDTHSEPPLKLVDLGDLTTFRGMEEIDAKGKNVKRSALKFGEPFDLRLLKI